VGLPSRRRLTLLTQVPTRRRLTWLASLTHLDSYPTTAQVHTLHLLLRTQGLLVHLELRKPVPPGLLRLSTTATVSGGVGLVDDVAVLELAEFLEGSDQLLLGESLVDVADVETGV
jgi:hypothetical protein